MLVAAMVFGLLACSETANLEPALLGVEPEVVSNREETRVGVSGRYLYRSIEVDLAWDSPPMIYGDFEFSIDGTPMPANRVLAVDSGSMELMIPAGLALGFHDLEVTIPDGRRALLENAFEVADCIGSECAVDCGDGVCAGQETVANCPADCQWWDVAWSHRIRLGFDHSEGLEDLDDFPVLVVIDSTMVDLSVMQNGGEDLRFVDEDLATELPYEIELWEPNGLSYVWVQVPKIDRGSDQDHIWMYYGNSTASAGSSAAGVWTSSYESVWHLGQASAASFLDSTGNGNDLSSAGGIDSGQLGAGQVAGSLNFEGDDYLVGNTSSSLDITGDMTLMAWVYPESWNTIFPRIIHYHSPTVRYVLGLVGEQNISTEERCWWAGRDDLDANALRDTLFLNTWTHIAAVFDSAAGTWRLYQDGVEVAFVDADDIQSDTEQMSIGVRYETTGAIFHLDASLDEVRIISAQRSATWLHAQHHTMTDTFVIYGSEEALNR